MENTQVLNPIPPAIRDLIVDACGALGVAAGKLDELEPPLPEVDCSRLHGSRTSSWTRSRIAIARQSHSLAGTATQTKPSGRCAA
jgi:hypothetical protein